MTRTELWGHLLQQAEQRCAVVRQAWEGARAEQQRLGQSVERLANLSADYAARQSTLQSAAHDMRHTAELRHMVQKVLRLQQQAQLAWEASQAQEARCQEQLREAEAAVRKAQHLQERALATQQRERTAQEQKALDALALVRYGRR